jgi:hypothetical protein
MKENGLVCPKIGIDDLIVPASDRERVYLGLNVGAVKEGGIGVIKFVGERVESNPADASQPGYNLLQVDCGTGAR